MNLNKIEQIHEENNVEKIKFIFKKHVEFKNLAFLVVKLFLPFSDAKDNGALSRLFFNNHIEIFKEVIPYSNIDV